MADSLDSFYNVMQQMEQAGSAFLTEDFEAPGFCLELKYCRHDFIADVNRLLLGYDIEQKNAVTSRFGFVLKKSPQWLTFRGYPSVRNLKEDDIKDVSEVYDCVKRFTLENEISVENNPLLSHYLNVIAGVFPEFYTIIGKIQHHTHSYSVDVHTLKVLQGIMLNRLHRNLSFEDRHVLQAAVLMHDFTKKEGEIDKSHPECSSKDAAVILSRFDISESLKKRICLIIRHHDWSERYNRGITAASEFAEILKNGNDFLMLYIMAEADLKAVKRGGAFYEKYGSALHRGYEEINTLINMLISAA